MSPVPCLHKQARHVHGTEQCYISDRCRCSDCRKAHAENARHRRRMLAYGRWDRGSVDNVGCRRRIQALACLGWSMPAIAELAGTSPRALQRLWETPGVSRPRAAAIAAAYEQLWDKTPPARTKGQRIGSARTVNMARNRGYLPPMAWDDIDDPDEFPSFGDGDVTDEVRIHRALAGQRVDLTRAERREAVRLLTERGLSAKQISERLGSSTRQVQRYRAAS